MIRNDFHHAIHRIKAIEPLIASHSPSFSTSCSRRCLLNLISAGSLLGLLSKPPAHAANEATSLGLIDDTLGSCAGLRSCVSSYDDRPSFFASPWELEDQPGVAVKKLTDALRKLCATEFVEENGSGNTKYVRARVGSRFVEFLLISDGDFRVEVRAVSSEEGLFGDLGENERLLEDIRSLVGYPKIEVLRNRTRRLIFIESPWDSYGPPPPLGLTESMMGKKLIDWEEDLN
jgi:uncharacterized protein (DUF1499 family)